MNLKDFKSIKKELNHLRASGQWSNAAPLLYNSLWLLAERRPDFEELPDWILSQEEMCADLDFEHHADQATVACHSILLKVVDTYCAEHDQERFRACESSFFSRDELVELDRIPEFVPSATELVLTFNQSILALPLTLEEDSLRIGRHTRVSFNRTVRIPEDGKSYPLPAGLGRLPIVRVEDYADRVPESWLTQGGFIVPLYQREALFLEFEGASWRPTIAKVGVGGVNAITGKEFDDILRSNRQDYVVVPDQRWLDGILSETGQVRQFIAMPLGQGYTIEAQVTDAETRGGFQISAFDPKAGRFAERSPEELQKIARAKTGENRILYSQHSGSVDPSPEMGIAAGGKINQQIIEDLYGFESWDAQAFRGCEIHIVNSEHYFKITGESPPPSPITIGAYQKLGYPWYSHYEEALPAVRPPGIFKRIFSVGAIDKKRKVDVPEGPKLEISAEFIHRIHSPTKEERIEALLRRASESLQAARYSIAIREASLCHDLNDSLREPLMIRAQAHYHLGNFRDAQMDTSLALSSNSLDSFCLGLRACSSYALEEFDEALYDLESILRYDPNNDLALTLRERIQNKDATP